MNEAKVAKVTISLPPASFGVCRQPPGGTQYLMIDPMPVDNVVADVHQYDLANDQPVLVFARAQRDNLVQPTFHVQPPGAQ